MIFAIIPFVLFYVLYKSLSGEDKQQTECYKYLAYAACSWGALLFIVTEALSLFECLTKTGLLVSWVVINLVLFILICFEVYKNGHGFSYLFNTEKRLILEYKNLSKEYKAGYVLVAVSILAVLILSRITVPYNWDSMSYHIPRIMFWAQNHSVAHYATEDARQLSSPFFAEFVNLNLYVLKGNDSCFNLLQGMSYCFNALFVYGISRNMGLDRKWSILAETLFISTPIVFAEALTTQVDLFATVWMVIFAYLALSLAGKENIIITDRETVVDIVMLGLSAGFGYIAKPSVCIAMAVYSLGLIIARIKKHDRALVIAAASFIAGITALFIMLPELLRNIYTFSAFSTSDVGAQQLVGTLSPRYLVINFIKNLAFNLPNIYVSEWSGYLYRFVNFVAGALKVDINDRSISERGIEYAMNAADDIGHDTAINAIIVTLFLIVIVISIGRMIIKRRPIFNNYCWCAVISYIVFLFVLRWEPYETRYQISYFALLSPFIAYYLSSFSGNSVQRGMVFYGIIMFLCICSFLDLYTRHYAKYKYETGVRPAGYFAANTILREWESVTSIVNMKQYSDIGFKTDNYHYSYPLWPMCKSINRVEYIVPEDIASAKYEDKTFRPQAILWFGDMEKDTVEWHGEVFNTIYSRGDYHVLENIDYDEDPSAKYIMFEDDTEEYFDELMQTDYTIFISAREVAANHIADEIKNKLYLLGVQSDLSDSDANSFLAVLKNKTSIRESYSSESIGTVGSFDKKHRYALTSTGEGLEGLNTIELDGYDFSQNLAGISIVVYDEDIDQVVDSVTIDTHADARSLLRIKY